MNSIFRLLLQIIQHSMVFRKFSSSGFSLKGIENILKPQHERPKIRLENFIKCSFEILKGSYLELPFQSARETLYLS